MYLHYPHIDLLQVTFVGLLFSFVVFHSSMLCQMDTNCHRSNGKGFIFQLAHWSMKVSTNQASWGQHLRNAAHSWLINPKHFTTLKNGKIIAWRKTKISVHINNEALNRKKALDLPGSQSHREYLIDLYAKCNEITLN